jgi:hypothetical protein
MGCSDSPPSVSTRSEQEGHGLPELTLHLGDRIKIQLSGGMHKRIVQYQY